MKQRQNFILPENITSSEFLLKSLNVQNNNDAETGVEVTCCETKTFLGENSVSTHKIFRRT